MHNSASSFAYSQGVDSSPQKLLSWRQLHLVCVRILRKLTIQPEPPKTSETNDQPCLWECNIYIHMFIYCTSMSAVEICVVSADIYTM